MTLDELREAARREHPDSIASAVRKIVDEMDRGMRCMGRAIYYVEALDFGVDASILVTELDKVEGVYAYHVAEQCLTVSRSATKLYAHELRR